MNRNGGVVKSNLSGEEPVKPSKNQKGVTPPQNEWQIDHIDPKDNGGSNSYSNAQVLSRQENRLKWNGMYMESNLITLTLKRDRLWRGCVLASIAHAIMVAHYPELSHEQSWDGINYSVQDNEGSRGTITFHPEYLAAAFRNDKSKRVL